MMLNKDDTVATDDIHNTPLDGNLSLQIVRFPGTQSNEYCQCLLDRLMLSQLLKVVHNHLMRKAQIMLTLYFYYYLYGIVDE
jgi:hypothetical protein